MRKEKEGACGSGLGLRNHLHSHICMPGTSFYPGPSEPEAQTAAVTLVPARTQVEAVASSSLSCPVPLLVGILR
jgi:hypothetical protein